MDEQSRLAEGLSTAGGRAEYLRGAGDMFIMLSISIAVSLFWLLRNGKK